MATNNASAFLQRLNSDVALKHRLDQMGNLDIESLVNFAAQYGYIFTAQNWREALAQSSGELDESALDQVVGGVKFQDFHFVNKINKSTP